MKTEVELEILVDEVKKLNKTCSRCKKNLPIAEFISIDGKRITARCKNCRESGRVFLKKYYEENKEAFKERDKKYREKNKEAIKERNKKYREKNKEAIKERSRKHYKENKEYYKKYTKANPFKTAKRALTGMQKRGKCSFESEQMFNEKLFVLTAKTIHKRIREGLDIGDLNLDDLTKWGDLIKHD